MVLSPLVIWLLPIRFFDGGAVVCPSKRFLNVNCPGCGLTRAFERITHGLFAEAWDFNKLSFLLYPLAIIIWLHVLGLIMGKQWMLFLRRWY